VPKTIYLFFYLKRIYENTWNQKGTIRNILDCDQCNVLLAHIIFPCILLTAFSSFLFTPQVAVPTASPRRQHQPCNWRHVKYKTVTFKSYIDTAVYSQVTCVQHI